MSFIRLSEALRTKVPLTDIQNILAECDASLYESTTSADESILHLALRYSTSEINIQILNHFNKFPSHKILLQRADCDGWTPLHVAARYGDYKTYIAVFNALKYDAYKACMRHTKKGLLPIKLLNDRNNPDSKIGDHMQGLMTIRELFPDHQDIINLDEILNYDNHDGDLRKNLIYGYIAMSVARRAITECSTHPSANQLSKSKYDNLVVKCNKVRNLYNDKNSCLSNSNPLEKLKNIIDVIKQEKAGRCMEYSYLVLDALLRIGHGFKNIEIFQFTIGDHVFIVLNRMHDSDPRDYNTWGKDAVVIDALVGDVYPANKIPSRLYNFVCYKNLHDIRVNILVPFDADYHKIDIKNDIKINTDFIQAKRKSDISIFTKDELNLLHKLNPYENVKCEPFLLEDDSDDELLIDPEIMASVQTVENENVRHLLYSIFNIVANNYISDESDKKQAICISINNSIENFTANEITLLRYMLSTFAVTKDDPLYFLKKKNPNTNFFINQSAYDDIESFLQNKFLQKTSENEYVTNISCKEMS